jgi:chemosensory pili system protein ChpC
MTRETPIDADTVIGMALPTGSADILLPRTAVAEIVAYRPPTPVPGAPDWFVGNLLWQQRPVPVVSIAAAQEEKTEVAPQRRTCLVVCYVPSGNRSAPFVALLAAGPPRLCHFRADEMTPAQPVAPNRFVLHTLDYQERPSWIPDMDAIERALAEVAVPKVASAQTP